MVSKDLNIHEIHKMPALFHIVQDLFYSFLHDSFHHFPSIFVNKIFSCASYSTLMLKKMQWTGLFFAFFVRKINFVKVYGN